MSRFPSSGVPVVSADIEAVLDGRRFGAAGALTIATGDTGAVGFVVPDDAQAAVTVDMTNANADLTYTAQAHGTGGNSITVTHEDPSDVDQPLAVSVAGNAITVSLATDGTGAITSTAAEVAAAIAASAAAAALVSCAAEGTGAGVVEAKTVESLSGGSNKRIVHLKPPRVSNSAAPVTVTLYEDVSFTGGSAITPRNRLRVGGGASRVAVSSLADATLVDGSGHLALDSIILAVAGDEYMGGEEDDNEWILGPGNYRLGAANGNAGNSVFGFQLRWTERDPDTM